MHTLLSILLVSIWSRQLLSTETPRRYVLVDNPAVFIATKYPYSNFIDLSRSMIVTMFNKPMDVSYITSLYTSSKNKSTLDATEKFLRQIRQINIYDFRAHALHPVKSFLLPFENKTLIGDRYKRLRLSFTEESTLVTVNSYNVSTRLQESEENGLEIYPNMSTSTMYFDPPVLSQYWEYKEQEINHIQTFAECSGGEDCASSKITESHLGVQFSLISSINSWFGSWFSSSKKKKPEPWLPEKIEPLLILKNLTIDRMEMLTRDFDHWYEFAHAESGLSFHLDIPPNEMIVTENFNIINDQISASITFPEIDLHYLQNTQVFLSHAKLPPVRLDVLKPSFYENEFRMVVVPYKMASIPGIRFSGENFGRLVCSIGEVGIPEIKLKFEDEGYKPSRVESGSGGFIRDSICRYQSRAKIDLKPLVTAVINRLSIFELPRIGLVGNKLVSVTPSEVKFRFETLEIGEPNVSKMKVKIKPGYGKKWTIGSSNPTRMSFPDSFASFVDHLASLNVDMPMEELAFSWNNQHIFSLPNLHIRSHLKNMGFVILRQFTRNMFSSVKSVFQRRGISTDPDEEWKIDSLDLQTSIKFNLLPFAANLSVNSFQGSASKGIQQFGGYLNLTYEYIADIARAQFREMAPNLIERWPAGLGSDYVNMRLVLDEVYIVGTSPDRSHLILKCRGTIAAEKKSKKNIFAMVSQLLTPRRHRSRVKIEPVILAEFSTTVNFEPLVGTGTKFLQETFPLRLSTHETLIEPKKTVFKNIDFKWQSYQKTITIPNSLSNMVKKKETPLFLQDLKLDKLQFSSTYFKVRDSSGVVQYFFNVTNV